MNALHEEVARVSLYEYRIPFKKPVVLAKTRLHERKVLLCHWQTADNSYWTEVAPLPGFSTETLEQCADQIKKLFSRQTCFSFSALKQALDDAKHLFPSVSFFFNDLLYNAVEPEAPNTLKICPLNLQGEAHASSPVVKIKVGQSTLDEDVERIQGFLEDEMFTGQLRLDANQQWTKSDIQKLCERIDCSRIEWLEDPLMNPEEYGVWADFSQIPLALDESLYKNQLEYLQRLPLKALILKPGMLGWCRLQHYLQMAKTNNWQTVISSCFEGPVGIKKLSVFALVNAPQEYHGLDTIKYFKKAFREELHPEFISLLEQWQW